MFYSRRFVDGVDAAVGFMTKRQRDTYIKATGNKAFKHTERLKYDFALPVPEYSPEAGCTIMILRIKGTK